MLTQVLLTMATVLGGVATGLALVFLVVRPETESKLPEDFHGSYTNIYRTCDSFKQFLALITLFQAGLACMCVAIVWVMEFWVVEPILGTPVFGEYVLEIGIVYSLMPLAVEIWGYFKRQAVKRLKIWI